MTFDLKLFGGLSLQSGSAPLPARVQQRRRLTLLALLAVGGDRGVSRERAQAYLWPESTSDRARHALDQLLYATRRDIGNDVILSIASELRLNPAVARVDLWEFDYAVRYEHWERAVQLYAGPILDGLHLIDGAEFELWLDAERKHRERDYHRALETLARGATARNDHTVAAGWWARRSGADPLNTPVAIELMRALAAAGDRAGAIRHARVHQQLVRTTLEVEPDPAIEALGTELAAPRIALAAKDQPSVVLSDGSAAGSLSDPDDLQAPAIAGTALGALPASLDATRSTMRYRDRRAGVAVTLTIGLLALVLIVRGESRRQSPTTSATAAPDSHRAARPNERLTMPLAASVDLQARSLYLRARASWQKRTKRGLDEAVVLFRRATERDPMYGMAHAGLAQSYAMLGYFGFADADAMFPKAKAAALRAIELDSAAGEAYAALGQAFAWQRSWDEAEQAYRRALEFAPRDPTVHQWYALLLAYVGRVDEAVLHTRDASRLDPLSVQINNMHGMMLFHSGDVDSALRQFERTVDSEPDSAWVWENPWVLSNFGRVAAAAGRHAQAVRLIESAARAVPGHPRPLLDLAHAYIVAGDTAQARSAFVRADTAHAHYSVYRALMHALLGEHDEAFARMKRIEEWPLPGLVQLNSERAYAVFRSDPRFQEIRKRLGLAVP